MSLHLAIVGAACALKLPAQEPLGRRTVLAAAPSVLAASSILAPSAARADGTGTKIEFTTAPSGLLWAELRPGAGAPPRAGQRCEIDYQMTRRAGAKIYSTVQHQSPFTFTLGDGSVIEGLELAVGGGTGLPPLLPGGARRVIVPQSLGYGVKESTWETTIRDVGPVPPPFKWMDSSGEEINSYVRFKNLYQNPNRYDQPDLVLDVKLRKVEAAVPQAELPPIATDEPPVTTSTPVSDDATSSGPALGASGESPTQPV